MEADGLGLAGSAGDEVVGVGDLVKAHDGPRDRSVVQEAQVIMASLGQRRVRLGDIDLAPEQVGQLAVVVPGVVPLQASGKSLEQKIRDPGREHLLGGVAVVVRVPVAGQQGAFPVDDDPASGLVDVGRLGEQPRIGHHLRLTASRHDHDLDVGAVARLQRPGLAEREVPLPVAKQRAVAAEERSVEIGVDAAQRHGAHRTGPARHARPPGCRWR